MSVDFAPHPVEVAPPTDTGGAEPQVGTDTAAVPRAALTVLLVAALLIGLVGRLWFILHSPSSADEGFAGILAQGALHGHVQAFYGGQPYGGTVEPLLVSVAFRAFGQTIVVARLVLLVLAAVASVLVWRIALRLTRVPSVALLAGALSWCAPAMWIRDSTRLYGFRGVTLVCGLAAVLLAVRISDGRRGWTAVAGLGLVTGVGWWSSPEIAYFVVPVVLILVLAVVHTPGGERARWWGVAGVMAASFALGALPWIWANVGSHLASLSTANSHQPAGTTGYLGHLSVIVHHVLPLTFGLTRLDDGRSFLGIDQPIVLISLLAVVASALVLCLLRGGPAAALAVGVLAFPFLYALSPTSWAWYDGRYATYLPPLLAVVLAVGATEVVVRVGDRPGGGSWLMAGALVVASILSVVGMRAVVARAPAGYTAGWGDPDRPTAALVQRMEAAGVRTAYADYWVAYKLDFVSRGRLAVTTAGYDNDRSPSIDHTVAHSRDPAWIFVPRNEAMRAGDQFTSPALTVGVDKVTQAEFEAALRRLDVRYEVIDLGLARVVVPARHVTPFEVGMPGSSPP